MIKFKSIHIDDMELEDFLSLEFNRALYKDFNESLKPHLSVGCLSFFKYIYRDAAFFYSNYKTTPYEVNEYFKEKYLDEGNDFDYLLMREIFDEIIYNATSIYTYSSIEEKYIQDKNDPFIHESGVFDFWGKPESGFEIINWLEEKRVSYRYNLNFYINYDYTLQLRAFLNSINISENHSQNLDPKIENLEKKNELIGELSKPDHNKKIPGYNLWDAEFTRLYPHITNNNKKNKNSKNVRRSISSKEDSGIQLSLNEPIAKILYSEFQKSILDVNVSKEVFLKTFSDKTDKPVIKISCETAEFAFLLKLLEEKKILPKPIEKKIGNSGLFLSKGNKTLSYDGMRRSRSAAINTGSAPDKIEAMTQITNRITDKIEALSK